MNNQFKIHLSTEIQYLKGVGPKRGKFLNSMGIDYVKDLLRNFPRKYLDRTNIKPINKIKINEKVVVIGTIESFGVKRLKKGKYFQLTVIDSTGFINCIWFHGISWIVDKFNIGDSIAIYGKIEFYKGYRITHPEFDILDGSDDPLNTGAIIPIYSTTNSLKQVSLDSRGIRRLIHKALSNIDIEDHFSQKFL